MTTRSYLLKSAAFLLAAFVLSGVGFALTLALPQTAYLQLPMYGPILAALIFTRRGGGSIAGFLKTRFAARPPLGAALIALALPLAVHAGVALASGGFAVEPSIPASAVPLFIAAMLLAVVGEEAGWRGYLLPLLEKRLTPFAATWVVGLIWAAWHIPAKMGLGMPGFALWALELLGFNVVFTWIYLRSKPSVWGAVLLHYAINVSGFMLLGGKQAGVLLAAAWLAVGAAVLALNWRAFRAQPEREAGRDAGREPAPAAHPAD